MASELIAGKFTINDIELTIPPENISIDRAAQIKQYKPLRTKGTAKVRSPNSSISITLQVKFVGLDEINNKLRPLVAQFLLTPFCYVENQYLRDSILGNDNQDISMALALQNLTVSTIESQPETWQVVFSFIWFNYKPYAKDLRFKDRLINRGQPQKVKTPGLLSPNQEDITPFQAFYATQLKKLRPVQLLNSELEMTTLEFLVANAPPDVSTENIPQISFENLRDFEAESFDFFNDIQEDFPSLERDFPNAKQQLLAARDTNSRLEEFNSTIRVLSSIVSSVQTNNPNKGSIAALLKKRDQFLARTALLSNGLWLEFPSDASRAPNRFNTKGKDKEGKPASSRLYYRANRISTKNGDLHSGLVVTSLTMNFGHKLAVLPMQGYQYPTCQHLGSGDVEFSIRISCLDDQSNRDFTDFWNVTQNNLQYGRFIPQEITNVQVSNELFKFFGVEEILFSAKNNSTTPEHPETYQYEIIAVENSLTITGLEQFKSIPISSREIRKLIWKAIWQNMRLMGARRINIINKDISEADKAFLNKLSDKSIVTNDSEGRGAFSDFTKSGLTAHFLALYNTLKHPPNDGELTDNFLSTFALTDNQVLGIEGTQESMRSLFKADIARAKRVKADLSILAKENIDFSLDEIDSRSKTLLNQQAEMQKRSKLITQLRDFIKANPVSDISRITRTEIEFLNGTSLKFSDITTDPAFNEEIFQRISEANRKFTSTAKATVGSLFATPFSDASFAGNIDQSLFNSVIADLVAELKEIKDARIRTSENFETDFLKQFDNWKKFTTSTADIIIDRYLNLPIFKEAKDAYAKMNQVTKGSLYQDMSFSEIEDYVNQQSHINTKISIEPDFYFWNESVDDVTSVALNSEVTSDIKVKTIEYVENINLQNNNWYQKVYRQKVNPDMQKFLDKYNTDKKINVEFTGDIGNPTSGLKQITKSVDLYGKSVNAFVKDLKGTYQCTINKPERNGQIGLGPLSSNNYNVSPSMGSQPASAGSAMNLPIESFMGTAELQAKYGKWIPPLQSFAVIQTPGNRIPPVPGASSSHKGTDLGFRPRGTNPVVVSTLAGKVIAARFDTKGGAGNFVEIDSEVPEFGTVRIGYFHLAGIFDEIKEGMQIEAGVPLGLGGASGNVEGPHLHFQVESLTKKQLIYPFKSVDGDRVAANNPNMIVVDLIQVTHSNSSPTPQAYLPNSSMGGITSSISAFDHSLASLDSEWQREAGFRMNRAYPSFYLAFIEDELEDNRILKFDDYFSFSSVVSMYCVRDREVPADYVNMQLTNISGLLSNRKYTGTSFGDAPVFQGKPSEKDPRRDPDSVNTDESFRFQSLLLREGIKVELRLGYSNDPDNLEVMFIGRITSVQFSESDDIIELELQSLATELVQDVKGVDKIETVNGALGGLFVSDARTGPLLESLLAESPECISFGFWQHGERDRNTNRDLLTTRWVWNPEPSTDNIFAPPSDDLDPRKFFLGSSFITKTMFAGVSLFGIGAGFAALAGQGIVGATSVGLATLFGIGGTTTAGYALLGKLGKSLTGENLGVFSALTYFMYQTTIWDIFKEMEHRHPDCIASPVPYVERLGGRTRMTMFFGNPDWLYFARDPTGIENAQSREIIDKGENLKDAVKSKLLGAQRFNALKEFADLTDLSDESIGQLGTISQKIKDPKIDDSVLQDIDALVERERFRKAQGNGSIRPFRRYHIVTSGQHIIANNIRAKSANTFNAVTINYAKSDDEVRKTEEGPKLSDVEELTMKLDPLIPDELVRESVYTYVNCQGENMAKRYAVSHLQKGCWQIYQGDLVILGNPRIKPYDIVFVYDEYSDMYGPVQVRRVTHMFDYEHGFISIITPDLITTITEGVLVSQMHAMGLAAEHYLGLKNVVKKSEAPLGGVQTDSPWKLALGASAISIASFFGMKKILFLNQFGHPVTIHPLIHQGQAMVAGFGPPGVRENEFIIQDVKDWFLARSRAAGEVWEEFRHMWDNREGLLNTRGELFSSGEGLLLPGIGGGENKLGTIIGGKKQ